MPVDVAVADVLSVPDGEVWEVDDAVALEPEPDDVMWELPLSEDTDSAPEEMLVDTGIKLPKDVET